MMELDTGLARRRPGMIVREDMESFCLSSKDVHYKDQWRLSIQEKTRVYLENGR